MRKKFILIAASILLLTSCAKTNISDNPAGASDSMITSAAKKDLFYDNKSENEPENLLDNKLDDIPQILEINVKPEQSRDAVLAQDNLNGFNAELCMSDIHSLPSEEDDAYRGGGLCVKVTDENGKTVTSPIENDYDGEKEAYLGISADCVKNGVTVYRVEQNGKKEYVVVQRGMYNKETGRPRARFLICDMALYNDNDDVLMSYKLKGSTDYSCYDGTYFDISDSFIYVGGTKFADTELGVEYELDPKEHTGTVRPLIFSEPEVGGNAILAEDSLNGYTASLEVINIRGDMKDEDIIWGGRLLIRLTDPNGKTKFLSLLNGYDTQFGSYFGIPSDCIKDAVKIYEIEENGEKSYVVLQRGYKNEITGKVRARLLSFDSLYDSENGAELPEWYSLNKVSPYFHSPAYMYIDITDSFTYLGGTSFADEEAGYRIELDGKTRTGKVTFSEI